MQLGIFSGTFDPVHEGHLAAAQRALEQHQLTKVLFVPEAQPRLKSNVTPFAHRWAILELALKNFDNFELWRADQAQHSQQTLQDIAAAYPLARLFLMLGQDIAPVAGRWPDGTPVETQLAQLIIMPRSRHSSAAWRANQAKGGVPAVVVRYSKEHRLYL